MISQGENNPGRKEHDSFGDIEVPAGALWGAQTERARRNFAGIGGGPLPRDFITAIALIKGAAARANATLGLLPADLARAIQALIDDSSGPRRSALMEQGARIAEQYLPERVMPLWGDFLRRVAAA